MELCAGESGDNAIFECPRCGELIVDEEVGPEFYIDQETRMTCTCGTDYYVSKKVKIEYQFKELL